MNRFNKHLMKGDDTPIKPSLALANEAVKEGVAVFFITGRTQDQLQATKRNLNAVGYHGWKAVYDEPNNYRSTHPSVIPFKADMRETIESEGYDIIANVGDQYSDLKGGFADRTFKLPDPLYYVP